MTATIIDLSKRRPDPHVSGPAKCLACGHDWVAVAPTGTVFLECPACRTERGVWATPLVDADPRTARFVCNTYQCGNEFFQLTKHPEHGWAAACARCGTLHGVEAFA